MTTDHAAELAKALEPFTHTQAKSLHEALGYIEWQHLLDAVATLATYRQSQDADPSARTAPIEVAPDWTVRRDGEWIILHVRTGGAETTSSLTHEGARAMAAALDPGPPSPNPEWEALALARRNETEAEVSAMGEPEPLIETARMLNKWAADTFPANEQGQVHFARALMESAAFAIRQHLAAQPGERRAPAPEAMFPKTMARLAEGLSAVTDQPTEAMDLKFSYRDVTPEAWAAASREFVRQAAMWGAAHLTTAAFPGTPVLVNSVPVTQLANQATKNIWTQVCLEMMRTVPAAPPPPGAQS